MKKSKISEMTSAGAVAAVPQSMNTEAITHEPPKPSKTKSKKRWRNSLHENTVSEAELSEQDLILSPGIGRKLKPGLMRNQQPHEALEMAMSDLLQCVKNSRRIFTALRECDDPHIEPWVQEKIVKASDYLNTVCEYVEGQVAMKSHDVEPSVLTFEQQVIAELSKDTLKSYQQKVSADSMKHPADPTKRKPEKASRSVSGFAQAQKRLEKDMKLDESEFDVQEGKTGPGLWANIHAKRERIKKGSGERMRKPGSKGAPTDSALKAARDVNEATKYPEDTWVIVKTETNPDKTTTKSYPFKFANEADGKAAIKFLENIISANEKLELIKNPNIENRDRVDEMKQLKESHITRGANLLSSLKIAARSGTGYTIVGESFSADLEVVEVKKLLESYNRAIQKYSESAVISAFGNEQRLLAILQQQFNEGKNIEKMTQRWSGELSAKTKEKQAAKLNPQKLPPDILRKIELDPAHRQDIINDYLRKQEKKTGQSVAEAKAKNPYAIGMAAAKKEAGITTTGKPVPKKVVKKAHKIAKAIDEDINEATKVKDPYAVGMAVAKREAGVKGKHVTKPVIKKAHEIAKAIKKEQK